jgi:hypothetical protein
MIHMSISAETLGRFTSAPSVSAHRLPEARLAHRPFLVFVRSGSSPVPQPAWPAHLADRQFDVLANFHAPPSQDCWLLDYADYVTTGGLSKFHAAKQLLNGEMLHRYAGVLFLDDDIETLFDPGAFAQFVTEQGFALAQAALTSDSSAGHPVTLHHPSCAWRETNFVEVMAPFFTQALLANAIEDFDRSISSWGLDVLWGARYAASHCIAIVDLFTMAHRRASDLKEGAFYRHLATLGVDPLRELAQVFRELAIERFDIVTRKVVFRQNGIELAPEAGSPSAA